MKSSHAIGQVADIVCGVLQVQAHFQASDTSPVKHQAVILHLMVEQRCMQAHKQSRGWLQVFVPGLPLMQYRAS